MAGKIFDKIQIKSSIAPKTSLQRVAAATRDWQRAGDAMIKAKVVLSNWFLESSRIAASCQRYSTDSWETAFSQTVIGNKAAQENVSYKASEHHNRPNDYLSHYWHFRQALNILAPGGVINQAPFNSLNYAITPHESGFHKYEDAYADIAQDRRFFATLGGYMGIGPPDTQIGDSVCVFLGGRVPWVIRRDGDDFVLIGECYVQ